MSITAACLSWGFAWLPLIVKSNLKAVDRQVRIYRGGQIMGKSAGVEIPNPIESAGYTNVWLMPGDSWVSLSLPRISVLKNNLLWLRKWAICRILGLWIHTPVMDKHFHKFFIIISCEIKMWYLKIRLSDRNKLGIVRNSLVRMTQVCPLIKLFNGVIFLVDFSQTLDGKMRCLKFLLLIWIFTQSSINSLVEHEV